MNNQKRINALYCRVSTDGQQTGLESQIRALKDWCNRNLIAEYEIFADEGISGAKESRPALNRLMTMVENNQVEQFYRGWVMDELIGMLILNPRGLAKIKKA